MILIFSLRPGASRHAITLSRRSPGWYLPPADALEAEFNRCIRWNLAGAMSRSRRTLSLRRNSIAFILCRWPLVHFSVQITSAFSITPAAEYWRADCPNFLNIFSQHMVHISRLYYYACSTNRISYMDMRFSPFRVFTLSRIDWRLRHITVSTVLPRFAFDFHASLSKPILAITFISAIPLWFSWYIFYVHSSRRLAYFIAAVCRMPLDTHLRERPFIGIVGFT